MVIVIGLSALDLTLVGGMVNNVRARFSSFSQDGECGLGVEGAKGFRDTEPEMGEDVIEKDGIRG